MRDRANPPDDSLATQFGRWTALYGAFLFLAGWSYLHAYFRVFGVAGTGLDIGLNDTLAQGFLLLFGAGAAISAIYVVVFGLSVVVELTPVGRHAVVRFVVPLVLIALFPVTYLLAARTGITRANEDRGADTHLPTITFAAGGCDYKGKLLYLKGELLYIYNLEYLQAPAGPCPFDLAGASQAIPQLWLTRPSALNDVRIVHFEKEAKP